MTMAIAVGKETLRRRYRWNDVSHLTARDRALFNRAEGYEILAMVQLVANHFGYTSVEEIHAVEDAIRHSPHRHNGWRKKLAYLISELTPDP